MSWKQWPAVTVLRRLRARARIPMLRGRAHEGRRLNFYVLSTGRVGTRFLSHVLATADNATVYHQPGPQLKDTVVPEVVRAYASDIEAFRELRVEDFPLLEAKVREQLVIPSAVYGDTLNHMFPFGHMLHRFLGADRVRLIHLIRNPITCCRSILVSEKDWGEGGRFGELRPPEFLEGEDAAEKAAGVWNGVNRMVARQFEMIDDPDVCRVVRTEDFGMELFRDLFAFLGLEGFDEERVRALMNDRSHDVRHSHVRVHDDRDVQRWELERIAELCGPLAGEYGYTTDVDAVLGAVEERW